MDILNDTIDEIVTTIRSAEPNIRTSSRKRRAKFHAPPVGAMPDATLSETVTTVDRTTPVSLASSRKRRATVDTSPVGAMPDAPLQQATVAPLPMFTAPAADEAIVSPAPLGATPRRRKSRAVQNLDDTHSRTDSAPGRTELSTLPEMETSDPTLDAGHSHLGVRRKDASIRRRDHHMVDNPRMDVAAAPLSDGRFTHETQVPCAIHSDDGAHISIAAPWSDSPVVAEIIQLWRMRQRWHRAEKSLILQGRAVCRAWTGGDKTEANKLFDRAAKGEGVDPALTMALLPFLKAIENFAPERARIEKQLRKLAQSLPVWAWAAEVKGFGALNLAAIVGEAGDVGSYRNPSCLWKRMGLAVIGGGRQRRVADAELALEHGYNPSRRTVAYLLGDCLVKAGEACRYRPVYDERKAYELAREDEGKPKTLAHAHNRATRYMTKRVLRHLRSAWRACVMFGRRMGKPVRYEPLLKVERIVTNQDELVKAIFDELVWAKLVVGLPADIEPYVPYCGVWKSRTRDGIEYPVRTFRGNDGEVYAWDGLTRMTVKCDVYWLEDRFGYLLKRPCSAEDYQHWLDHGEFPPEPPKERRRSKK